MKRKIHYGTCSICGIENSKLKILSKSICKICYKKHLQPKEKCIDCKKIKTVGKNTDLGQLCDSCSKKEYNAPKYNCFICGNYEIVRQRNENNEPICPKCYKYPKSTCCICGSYKRVNAISEFGPICGKCYVNEDVCSQCKKMAPVCKRDREVVICPSCYVAPLHMCIYCNEFKKAGKHTEMGVVCINCYESPKQNCSVCHNFVSIVGHDQSGGNLCNNCYTRYRRHNDEKFNIISRLRIRFAEAFRTYSNAGKVKPSKKYGIDYNAIFKHIGPCPGERSEWHIDHIKPLCLFDFDNPEQVKLAFAPENHQWLHKIENFKKGKKHNEENNG